MSQSNHSRFRLREVLILLAIVGVLAGLIWPAILRVHEAAARTECASNLKVIGVAVHSANDLYKKLPPVNAGYPESTHGIGPTGTVLYHLLPFMTSTPLYKAANDSDLLTNPKLHQFSWYCCPSDPSALPRYPQANFSPNYWLFMNRPGGRRSIQEVAAGTSNVLAFSERRRTCINGGGSWSRRDRAWGAWVESLELFQFDIPNANGGANDKWHEIHSGGINVLMLDGAVTSQAADTDRAVWRRMLEVQEEHFDPKKISE